MIKISSRIKLPLKICQGSASTRHKSAEKNLAKFVNKVEPELNKKEELSLNRIQALLKESIPCRKIYIETIESVDDAGDNFLIHSNENGTLDALAIELQTNKNGKIGKQERNSLYHEAWHVFEHLYNPKLLAHTANMSDELTQKYLKFYHKNFYTIKKFNPEILTGQLNKFLKKFNTEDKVKILQQLRYDLQSENQAYSIAGKYADYNGDFSKFNFLPKKEIVQNTLKEIFTQRRNLNKN